MSTLSTKIVTLAPVPAIINLVSNPNTATGWLAANGGATLATTQAAGDLPLGTAITTAIKLTSGTSTRAEGTLAETTSYAFTTPAAYAVKTGVEFWLRPGTNFLDNEWTVSIYAGAVRQALTTDASSITYIPNANGKFTTYFDAVASTAYTLRFTRTVNAGTNAAVLNLASVIVGPGIQPQGAVVGPALAYTPTTDGFGTVSGVVAFYSRRGSFLKVEGRITAGTVNGNTAYVSLPTGLNVDTSVITSDIFVGKWWRNNSSATTRKTGALATDYTINANILRFNNDDYTTGVAPSTSLVGSAVAGTGEAVWFDFELPIAEWAGSGTVNLAQNDVEYAFNTSTSDADDTTSFGYGPAGTTFVGVQTAAHVKRVRFKTPIQSTDQLVLQMQAAAGNSQWIDVGGDPTSGTSIYNFQNSGTYGVGIGSVLVSSTDVDVKFGQYKFANGATYGSAGAAWAIGGGNWRVKKISGGQAVGFGAFQAASSANPAGISGLVPALGLPGRTDGVAVPAGVIGERINSTALSQTATVTANTAVDVSGSALPLTPGVWLVYFMGLFRIRNLSGGALDVSGAIQLTTNAGVFAGGIFEVAGLQTLTGADTTITASFAVPIVVTTATTYKLQVINSASAANSIAYFSSGGTFGNDGFPQFYGLRIG